MVKRNIEMVALEAASFEAEVKEVVGGSTTQARNLAEIGRAAYDGLFELGSDAGHDELRKRTAMDGLSARSQTDTLSCDGTFKERAGFLDCVGRRGTGEH